LSSASEIFPSQSTESFHEAVRKRVEADLKQAEPGALLAIKKLIRAGLRDKNDPDLVNMRESLEQARRVATGIPGMAVYMHLPPLRIDHRTGRRFQATVDSLGKAHRSKL
jgi:hypothetical protein